MKKAKAMPKTMPERLTGKHAAFLKKDGLPRLFDALESAGGTARVNGGAVRNALIGMPVSDTDLSTDLPPRAVTATLEAAGIKVVPTGFEHGTVTAVVDGAGHEVTTLREDIETDGRRAVVRFGTDWRADAERRDFTMNALYCDRDGRLFDPLGGYADLAARRVRFIGDPDTRIAEDRLRILRFFRFFAWYGASRPDPEGLKACTRHRGELGNLSAERVWKEIRRLLEAPDPSRGLLWMRQTGVLTAVLPETEKWGIDLIAPLVATEKKGGWAPDPLLRLAAMIPPDVARIEALAVRLKLSAEETRHLTGWARLAPVRITPDFGELRKAIYSHGRQPVMYRLRLTTANAMMNEGVRGRRFRAAMEATARAEAWQAPVLPVGGRDLGALGFEPGPKMGETLAALEQRWIDSDFELTREQLLGALETE